MKTQIALLSLLALGLASQTASADAADYAVAQRDLHSRVWQKLTLATNAAGLVRTNVHSYTELRNGLCRLENGVLVDSADDIELDPAGGGARALHTQHKVHWKANINAPGGAVTLLSRENKILKSKIFGICYYDATADTNLLIADLKDSQGLLVGSNQVVFPDAFNHVVADVSYQNSVEGLEQNIVFRAKLPSPADYGLNPQTTEIQILTEFFSPPIPRKTIQTNQALVDDRLLDFGDMLIPVGEAFLAAANGRATSAGAVRKEWIKLENRDFLIESIPWSRIAPLQDQLPAHASIAKPAKTTRLAALQSNTPGRASGKRNFRLQPSRPPAKGRDASPRRPAALSPDAPRHDFNSIALAQNYSPNPALVIDYTTVNSPSNNGCTFAGGATFYLSGPFSVTAGTAVFEGGSILKFARNAALNIYDPAQVNCQSTNYLPFVLTAKDDDSVGDIINGSSHTPTGTYANPGIAFYGASSAPSSLNLHHFRISYATQAIYAQGVSLSLQLTDGQIVNCTTALYTPGQGVSALNNLLIANFNTALQLGASTLTAENTTFSGNPSYSVLVQPIGNGNTTWASFINCIMANVASFSPSIPHLVSGDHNGFYSSGQASAWLYGGTTFGSSPVSWTFYPFQTFAGGSYYLVANNNPFRQYGTTAINSTLLADLDQKTTQPPPSSAVYSNNPNSTSISLTPEVPRDTVASGHLDLGYHYDPIDATFSGVTLAPNASLTISPGTAAACLASSVWAQKDGIKAQDGCVITAQGTATAPIHLATLDAVQECPQQTWQLDNYNDNANFLNLACSVSPMTASFRFCNWSCVGSQTTMYADEFLDSGSSTIALRDCQFYNGNIFNDAPVVQADNCLFHRAYVTLMDSDAMGAIANTLYNNLFVGGHFWPCQYYAGGWTFRDNLFDQTIIWGPVNSGDSCDHNAYAGIPLQFTLTGAAESGIQMLASSPAYQTGSLGSFYYPSTLTTLIHSGSRSAADAGLYHYTVTADNAKDGDTGNGQVSIGFHYVACDANGKPIDSNNDNDPDYLADANGDGIQDLGETPWAAPPFIDTTVPGNWPLSQIAQVGDMLTYRVTPSGTPPFTYHWMKATQANGQWQWQDIPGETGPAYSRNAVWSPDDQYQYAVRVTNPGGTIDTTSSPATLQLAPPPDDGVPLMAIIGNRQDYIFRSDQTYIIMPDVAAKNFYGTTTIEGGSRPGNTGF